MGRVIVGAGRLTLPVDDGACHVLKKRSRTPVNTDVHLAGNHLQ